ncbi:hypothetical protein, partial [Escherichia coli]
QIKHSPGNPGRFTPGAQIHLVTVNDYGVNVTSEHAL